MPHHPKRKLGRTVFDATVLGLDAMELRGAPRGPELRDRKAEHWKLIDTSLDYGASEERIGRFVAHRCDESWVSGAQGPTSDDAHSQSDRRR
jgi:aryl-alcohol dehydrogenase-like predicted oxidoreductase